MSDNKSPQVSRTLLSILTELNNVEAWMVSICPIISKSSSPWTNPMVTVPSAPITTCITVTFIVNFFSVLYRDLGTYLSSRFLSVLSSGHPKLQSPLFSRVFWVFFFFFLSLGLVVWPRIDDPFVSQNPKEFYASYFLGRIPRYAKTICSYCQI